MYVCPLIPFHAMCAAVLSCLLFVKQTNASTPNPLLLFSSLLLTNPRLALFGLGNVEDHLTPC